MFRIATFNIYWFGHATRAPRSEEHLDRLAQILRSLDADVLVLQEIVDHVLLRALLARAGEGSPRAWTFVHDGMPVTSGTTPGQQHVVVAWDRRRLTSVGFAVLPELTRPAVAWSGRDEDGARLRVAGLHLKSGWPAYTDPACAERRRREAEAVVRWIDGFEALPSVVCGDLNGPRRPSFAGEEEVAQSLSPLREWAGWTWPDPLAGRPDAAPVSNWDDGVLIDHILAGPGVGFVEPPTLVPFDLEPGGRDKRISDHRPVTAQVRAEA